VRAGGTPPGQWKYGMTTREKWIVGATVVALVYAGVTLWQGRREKASSGGAPDASLAELESFVAQSRVQLAGTSLSDVERTVLDLVQSGWDGGAFAVYDGPTAMPTDGAAGVPEHVYAGYVQAGGIRFAIINGREYRENETLVDGSGVVDTIAPGRVVLRVGGENRLRTLVFQDPRVTKE